MLFACIRRDNIQTFLEKPSAAYEQLSPFWVSIFPLPMMSRVLVLTLVAATHGLQLHTGIAVPNGGLHATPLGVATLRSQLRQAREHSNGVRAYLWCHLWSLWAQPTIKNAPPPQVPISNVVGIETAQTQPTEATLDWLQQYSRTREVTLKTSALTRPDTDPVFN